MKITKIEAIADKGKKIRRIGDNSEGYSRCTILKGETETSFEEAESFKVTNIPLFKERVIERVRERYSVDDELAILRQRDTKPQEYQEYFDYVESVKAEERNKI